MVILVIVVVEDSIGHIVGGKITNLFDNGYIAIQCSRKFESSPGYGAAVIHSIVF